MNISSAYMISNLASLRIEKNKTTIQNVFKFYIIIDH